MKLENRDYKEFKPSVEVLGITDADFQILKKVITQLRGEAFQEFTASVPENISGSTDQMKIDGIVFEKNSGNLEKFIDPKKNVEDVITILSKNGNHLIANHNGSLWSRIKVAFKNDPYHKIKSIGNDGTSMVLFYSPEDKDIELYIPKDLYASVVAKLEAII